MFGMGFMEIFLVLIVAIIALGPEKLPTALVDMAKFFKKIKGEINDAKATLDNELDISQMKQEAQELKASITNVKSLAHIDMDDINTFEDKKEEEIESKPKKNVVKKEAEPKKAKSKKEKNKMTNNEIV